MKNKYRSLINTLLIATSCFCTTPSWSTSSIMEEVNLKEPLITNSFISIGTTADELEGDFFAIGYTPKEVLNLDAKKITIIEGNECGSDFLLIERDIFNRQGKINNKKDFSRLLKEEGKKAKDFTKYFVLDSLEEDLYIPEEWRQIKGYPVPIRSKIMGAVGNALLNTALGHLGAGLTRVASNYVIVHFGEPLAEIAAQASIALNHKIFNLIWPSQTQKAPNKSWFRGWFEKTSDNFEYTNTKAEMLRRVGALGDATVKYSVLVGQGAYNGVKSVASYTKDKISHWWNKG